MKQCPKCQGMELYDDKEQTCPHCGSLLMPYLRSARRFQNGNTATSAADPVRPQATAPVQNSPSAPTFESRNNRMIHYRGVVVSISPTSRFMHGFVKWINAIFKGQPYQLGNPVHETIIRIENITQERIPDRMRSLVLYGQTGEIDIGDDVTVTAVEQGGRYVVKKLLINDTGADVRAYGQISATVIRILTLISIALAILFVSLVISFFSSGGIWTLLSALVGGTMSIATKLLVTLSPLAALLLIYWLLIRGRR